MSVKKSLPCASLLEGFKTLKRTQDTTRHHPSIIILISLVATMNNNNNGVADIENWLRESHIGQGLERYQVDALIERVRRAGITIDAVTRMQEIAQRQFNLTFPEGADMPWRDVEEPDSGSDYDPDDPYNDAGRPSPPPERFVPRRMTREDTERIYQMLALNPSTILLGHTEAGATRFPFPFVCLCPFHKYNRRFWSSSNIQAIQELYVEYICNDHNFGQNELAGNRAHIQDHQGRAPRTHRWIIDAFIGMIDEYRNRWGGGGGAQGRGGAGGRGRAGRGGAQVAGRGGAQAAGRVREAERVEGRRNVRRRRV